MLADAYGVDKAGSCPANSPQIEAQNKKGLGRETKSF
jgi:hypothetical protein